METKTFWVRVKALLKAHKMTQMQFAERIDYPYGTLRSCIQNDRIPDTTTAYEIAVTLGVTLNYLLGGHERDITVARLRELEARNAAAKILKLTEQIVKEANIIKPLRKKAHI